MSILVRRETVVPSTSVNNYSNGGASASMGPNDETENRLHNDEDTNGCASYTCRLPSQFVLQDHNYGAPPPQSPPPSSPVSFGRKLQRSPSRSTSTHFPSLSAYAAGIAPISGLPQYGRRSQSVPSPTPTPEEDSQQSANGDEQETDVESPCQDEGDNDGEEVKVAREAAEEEGITRCICDFQHDDGYMICCDKCSVWQHVDCMGIDRGNIPEEYLCELCQPRKVDRHRARTLQLKKRDKLSIESSSDDSSDDNQSTRRKSLSPRKKPERRVKRQKRDVAKERSIVANKRLKKEKKSEVRRLPTKKKVRSRSGSVAVDEETQDSWDNAGNVRQWINKYEEAITNHYSPELRARIGSCKVNGAHSEFKANLSGPMRAKSIPKDSVGRILTAATSLLENQTIIECRGKYMLANQFHTALTKKYHPFVFFHKLPKEGMEVCVDARTYGNDARFVRRSCRPNSELKHCIDKGSLHIYIVASVHIEQNTEITVPYDSYHAVGVVPCACGGKSCMYNSTEKRNGFSEEEKKKRGRRVISFDEDFNPPPVGQVRKSPRSPTKTSAVLEEITEVPKAVADIEQDKKKMTREERKMEAIMKTIERLEKAEQRKIEMKARKKERGDDTSKDEDSPADDPKNIDVEEKSLDQSASEDVKPPSEHIRRKGKKRGRSASILLRRRSRVNSGESDVNSAEDWSLGAGASSTNLSNDGSLSSTPMAFKFPRTKKALMSEWLNETVTPVVKPHAKVEITEPVSSGVKTCYVRNAKSPTGVTTGHLQKSAGGGSPHKNQGSAKKRWLQQAIREETDSPTPASCQSPSRAESPPAQDYVTPLKKRRLARESMSSEQSSSPSTPANENSGAADLDLEGDVDDIEANDLGEVEFATEEVKKETNDDIDQKIFTKSDELTTVDNRCITTEETVRDSDIVDEKPNISVVECNNDCDRDRPDNMPKVRTVELCNDEKADVQSAMDSCDGFESESEEILPKNENALSVAEHDTELPTAHPKESMQEDDKTIIHLDLSPVEAPESTKPVPKQIKRKLSINEYKKRKQEQHQEPFVPEGSSSPQNEVEVAVPKSAPVLELPPLVENNEKKSEDQTKDLEDVRWNSAPTLVEQQRENLTARLKREFGLCLNEDESAKDRGKSLGEKLAQFTSSREEETSPTASTNLFTVPPPPPPAQLAQPPQPAEPSYPTISAPSPIPTIVGVHNTYGRAAVNGNSPSYGCKPDRTYSQYGGQYGTGFNYPGNSAAKFTSQYTSSVSLTLNSNGQQTFRSATSARSGAPYYSSGYYPQNGS